MHVYALNSPMDFFDGLIPLPAWLSDGEAAAGRARWAVGAILALADAKVDWDGDMRHEPYVGAVPNGDGGTATYLVVKQEGNGGTFVVSNVRMAWLEDDYNRYDEVRDRDLGNQWQVDDLGRRG
ncbi:hypothetical protein OOJ91_33545 [Micromonospora lupini]|uniref:hypothetical protein n=1 Tax=Micromonospora lupini TaxID=285679 RepID=UPI00224D68A3|nr:hypothetical protein [Micromonospora lupini]MCX5070771.1 hypothetical protein [Micromonospora lupini]